MGEVTVGRIVSLGPEPAMRDAQIAELRERLKNACFALTQPCTHCVANAELAALRAENERMREALRAVIDAWEAFRMADHVTVNAKASEWTLAREQARALLAEAEGKG